MGACVAAVGGMRCCSWGHVLQQIGAHNAPVGGVFWSWCWDGARSYCQVLFADPTCMLSGSCFCTFDLQRIEYARGKSDAVAKLDGSYRPDKDRGKKNAVARGEALTLGSIMPTSKDSDDHELQGHTVACRSSVINQQIASRRFVFAVVHGLRAGFPGTRGSTAVALLSSSVAGRHAPCHLLCVFNPTARWR